MTFRVHFADGFKLDVDAATSAEASDVARASHPAVAIIKIKIVKGS